MGTINYSSTEEDNKKPVDSTKSTEEITSDSLGILTFDEKDEIIIQNFEEEKKEVERPENEE